MKYSKQLAYFIPTIYYPISKCVRKMRLVKLKGLDKKSLMELDAHLFSTHVGRLLDWNKLESYNEKLQWEKLFNVNRSKIQLSDKLLVRDWVEKTIGKQYLVPLLGQWENVHELDFDSLPDSFVLKTNCASGDVIIVKDKTVLSKKDIRRIKGKLDFYLHYDWGFQTLELHYSSIKPMIIAEELLPTDDTDVPDYKFTCFDGVPYYCRVDIGRYHDHRRNTYDLDWNLQSWNAGRYPNTDYEFPKPENFDLMIELATKLSQGFPQVRVDFYNIDGRIFFGEMTFTSGSGFEPIFPEDMDYELGKLWKQDCRIS